MKIHGFSRMVLVGAFLALAGCGGGGGGSAAPTTQQETPAKATTTISGTVQFPSISNLVAKRVEADVPVYVQAYTLDGAPVGSPVVADANNHFTIPDLPPGVDYVLKSTKGNQVLKKLIEKVAVAPGVEVPDQTMSDVSTTAVVVASQKLAQAAGVPALNLGEPITLTDAEKNVMSSAIFTSVAPQTLEQTIVETKEKVQAALDVQALLNQGQDAAAPDLTGVTPELVSLVNMLNIVVAAVSTNTDLNKVLTGQAEIANQQAGQEKQFKELSLTGANLTQAAAAATVSSTVVSTVAVATKQYVPPPRVALDLSTNVAANTLYGIKINVVVPPGATIALLDESKEVPGVYKVDMSKVSLASGVLSGTLIMGSYQAATRTLSLSIVGSRALPTGRLATVVFDRTGDSLNFTQNAVSASDLNAVSLLGTFVLTGTSS